MECATYVPNVESSGIGGGITLHNVDWQRCPPGHSYGPAIRNHYLIHFITEGRGQFRKLGGGPEFALSAGDGFLICPGETTYYAADPAGPWTYYWVGFSGAGVEPLLRAAGLSAAQPIFRCDKSAGEHFLREIQDSFQGERQSELAAVGNLYLFFAQIRGERRPHSPLTNSDRYMTKALRYIHENYSYPITVQSVSDYVGINRSYLFKLFRDGTGMSVQKYLVDYRLRISARMLVSADHTVSEVCYSCGFTDPNHFTRIFKKTYGVPPSRFRGG